MPLWTSKPIQSRPSRTQLLLTRVNFILRRLTCRILGHARANVSMGTVGIVLCRRCLRITEQKTVRARVTRGDIEQRMRAHQPEGYNFVSVNWKKRKARFVSTSGAPKFISI